MFSVLGLFRSVKCPEKPSCSRNPCPFSHEDTHLVPQLQFPKIVQPAAASTSSEHLVPAKRTLGDVSASSPSSSLALEPPKKVAKTISAQGRVRTTVPQAATTPTGAPLLRISPAASKIAVPLRQTMLSTLWKHFAELYSELLPNHPDLARAHSLAQEEEVYSQSVKITYRTAMISCVARVKKRPKPDSISHPSVGTEAEIAKRVLESKTPKSIKYPRVQSSDLESLILSKEKQLELGYVLDPPSSPGGVQPSLEGKVYPKCDRCQKAFLVKRLEHGPETCVAHWGRQVFDKSMGEKQKIWSCCSQPLGSTGCDIGVHVFYENEVADLHARHAFSYTESSSASVLDVVALDCEMIYTTGGMRVARVSIVDGDGKEVFDELVRMDEGVSVLDFNTRFSGITSLDEARLNLVSVRKALQSYIGPSTIVIGHALENDLKTLRMIHPRCVDTVELFPHHAGLPYRRALRALVSEKLGQSIQAGGGTSGHSSLEDARATLDLVRWYLANTKTARLPVSQSSSNTNGTVDP
ncbi:hypothetical protein SISSUDRAFT_1049379 [Sistotremastrum suecicum HHB10207 ss-3]|uniref:Exonuclease domain-containing protein n=1 Tax=Sistotremastrum suecicum HHB10207 ss-3 TaxID=1314776 RepID=A0A166BX76_9AGAM|nr:hypothetical protein SISSUDRAFT_1049379 [Sistotremastrum suecicum HHB10207 ss-3]